MMKNKPEKTPKKNLLITLNINPSKWPHLDFLYGAFIEYFGLHLENKVKNENLIVMTALFEKVKDGNDFYEMISQTEIKVSKEEC